MEIPETEEMSPSEKPGERQRAWLIAGEKSDPNEPGRVHVVLDLDPATQIEPIRASLISTRCLF